MKRIFQFLVYILIFSSCEKNWLDVKTDKSLSNPSTLKDFQSLLDNSLMFTNTSGLAEASSDGHNISSQYIQYCSDYDFNAYRWVHDKPNMQVQDWNNAYKRIFYCNLALEGLAKIQPENSLEFETYNSVKGNALFYRAKNLYDLSQIYAQPYLASSTNSDLGLPLRLESDITLPSRRSSVQNTYEQIISDLTEAKQLLPVVQPYKTRASKPAAYALLARTYLSMEKYDKALEFADSCLLLNNSLVDFNSLSSSSSLPLGPVNNSFNKEVLFFNRTASSVPLYPALAPVDSSLFALYASDDLRKSIFFSNSNGLIIFKGMYADFTSIQFSGLAVDEVYLIRAECYARAGNLNKAMKDLNNLLRTRWRKINDVTTYVDQIPTTLNETLSIVLTERKKELIFRGLRWSDLRRLNRDSRFAVTLTRTVSGIIYTLLPNSFKYTLPIPDDIIQQTGMQQNPGWQ